MKYRMGLVSNSSSANFIVRKEEYPNVFSLMKELVFSLYNYDEGEETNHAPAIANSYRKMLIEAEKIKGMDPDTPVCFLTGSHNMCAFSTPNYIVAGCSQHDRWRQSVRRIVDNIPDEVVPFLKDANYLTYDDMYDRDYWLPEVNLVGQMKFWGMDKIEIKGKGISLDKNMWCTKKGHFCHAILITQTNTAECPYCYYEEHKDDDKVESRSDILDI